MIRTRLGLVGPDGAGALPQINKIDSRSIKRAGIMTERSDITDFI